MISSEDITKRLKIINKMNDEELGFAVRNNLIKWQEIKLWQEKDEEAKK